LHLLFSISVIEEANWLTLVDDLEEFEKPSAGFDAVLCMGNSFAHLPDFEGNQVKQKVALENFYAMVKPGGILVIDHRNYDAILDLGIVPEGKNVYYSVSAEYFLLNTINREIFAVLKVGEFALFQLAVDKILHLLQKCNG
jgi:SAM-dependent methyltransferase